MKQSLIYPYDTSRFLEAWDLWLKYRKEIKKPIRGTISEQAQLIKLSRMSESEEDAIAIIMQSIENNWQGLFPIKNKTNAQRQVTTRSAFEAFWN